uniref:Choline transporter-like protein n=1 Tax=Octactis speculum TaxID=3111310 RepID=A0A7S2F2D6_9STRA
MHHRTQRRGSRGGMMSLSSSWINGGGQTFDLLLGYSYRFRAGVLYCLDASFMRIERLAKYFNKWAFVFVAVYGYDFQTAGTEAVELFRGLGWTVIVNDDLIGNGLALGGAVSGALIGLIGWAYGTASGLESDAVTLLALFGVITGYGISAVLMNGLITSAVATVLICFAQNPMALRSTHTLLFDEMLEAWVEMHGPIMQACGYSVEEQSSLPSVSETVTSNTGLTVSDSSTNDHATSEEVTLV